MYDPIKEEFRKIAQGFIALQDVADVIHSAIDLCIHALKNGNKILFCGNGGSAADAQHLAAELVGRYKLNRRAFPGLALTVDSSILTAVANDFGYDTVFSRQVEGLGKSGDILYAISTSGNSKSVLLAMEQARSMGIHVIALTGAGGGKMKDLATVAICVPATAPNTIQEMHIAIGHLICDYIEKALIKS